MHVPMHKPPSAMHVPMHKASPKPVTARAKTKNHFKRAPLGAKNKIRRSVLIYVRTDFVFERQRDASTK